MHPVLKKVPPLVLVIASVCSCASAMGKSERFSAAEKLLDQQQWQQAQEKFSALSNQEGEKQDAALYWLAYAQFKNNLSQAALKSIKSLQKRFPKSRWLDDAKALAVEIKDKDGEIDEIDDDELKLYAINALMNRPSEKAATLLANIINGNSSPKLAKRALFVLSQMNTTQAYDLIKQTAANDDRPAQQIEAIKVLGHMGGQKGTEVLRNVYQTTQNYDAKYRILKSFMHAGSNQALLDVARTEQNDKLKTKAIKLLGHMSSGSDLMALYREPAFAGQRSTIIKSLANANDIDGLHEIIKTETDSELQILAVKRLGMAGPRKSGELITQLYNSSTSEEVKAASLHALFLQSNAKALIQIIKQEQNPTLKRKALKKLTLIDSDEAIDYFSDILGSQG